MKRILLSLWPPARRPSGFWALWPLWSCLLLFPLACWICEARDMVVFTQLWPFWLLALAPWIWRMHLGGFCGLSSTRASLATACRFGLLAIFVLLFAEPRMVRKDEHMAVMFVIDHSDSIVGPMTDRALEYVVRVAQEKPERDEIGLMFFGRNASVELPPGLSLPYEGSISVHVDRDGTNIAKALSLAAAMLPPETQSRIVLVSDGVSTEGPLASVIDDLDAREIPVDILPIDYKFQEEVWLERLDLPRFVKIGQPFEASVVLSSLAHGTGTLTLLQNGEQIARQPVSFHAGKNRFSLPVELTESGYYEYSARIEVRKGKDSWVNNNTAISFLYLKGKGRVLMVTDTIGNEEDWLHLEAALREGKREVKRITAFEFPRHATAMLPYDCIVFVNVPRDSFDEKQLQAAHDAVKTQGSGFLMVGGENSYGPGGYHNTPIEDLLPVTMDVTKRKVLPKGALVIVLHTCEFAQGNTWGKRITKKAIQVLNPRDEIGVLVYDWQGSYDWLFELTEAKNQDSMFQKINNAQIGDMPSFDPTMQMGFKGLQASDASAKHMIIISDGDPSRPTVPLMQKFVAAQIRVSTIVINPHQQSDTKTLRMVATTTGGRFYNPKDPNKLPAIFIKEAKTLRRSAIQNKTFVPTVMNASPIIKGLAGIPQLHGYTWTTPKPRSTVILDGPEDEDPDPVLAHWRYGVGASVAFTSDLSPRWGNDWIQWSKYSAFVRQLITEISRANTEVNAQIRCYADSSRGHIVVEYFDSDADFLSVAAQVDGPAGTARKITLKQVAPNRYEGSFPLQGKGRYQVAAVGIGAGSEKKVRVHGGFVVSYSSEYKRFRADNVVLERIRQRTGGRRLDGQVSGAKLFGVDRVPRLSSRSIVDLLLFLLACLIPLDVAFRRVQIDWATLRALFGGTRESTQTLSTLLKKKEQRAKEVAEAAADSDGPLPQIITAKDVGVLDDAKPLVRTTTADSARSDSAEGPKGPRQPKTITSEEKGPSGTTTSRLLEAKRRAQKKKQ